jgi:hypothetical protein
MIDNALHQVRGLTLVPAAHGKTTLCTTILPIFEICRDPNIRLALIGKNDTEAKQIMQVIQAELMSNAKLIEDFGPFRPDNIDDNKPWALTQFSVQKRTIFAKEPTVTVFGSGARTVLGHRTDHTYCDDVVTEKNSATPEQRMKLADWFDLCVETGPEEEDDKITVTGTRFDPDDLYGRLIELREPTTGEKIWKELYLDAITDEEEKVTLWEEKWPWGRLMTMKGKIGTLNFNKRYRNKAVDASRMVFKEEYVKGGYIGNEKYPGCLDYNYSVGDFEDDWRRVAGFDPAVGVSRSTKFCAHLALAVGSCKEHERCFWVIDLERDQLALPQQVDMILSKHQDYGLDASIIEANSYQAGLFQAVKQKMDDQGLAMRIEPHYTSRTNKPDPEVGVQSMSAWFENGKIHIPYGDVHSRRKMEQFIDELVQYPGKTTDTVMAFWFAWKYLQQSGPKYQSYNRLRKREWGKRMSKRVVKNPYYARDVDD